MQIQFVTSISRLEGVVSSYYDLWWVSCGLRSYPYISIFSLFSITVYINNI
jgi:hypothetical protein